MLAANERKRKHQDAIDEYAHRKATLADYDYLRHAFVGYWIVPAIFLLLGGIRRAL